MNDDEIKKLLGDYYDTYYDTKDSWLGYHAYDKHTLYTRPWDVLKDFYPHFEPKKPVLGKHLIGLPVQITNDYFVDRFGLRSNIGIIRNTNQKDETITADFVTNATIKAGNKYLNIVKSITLSLDDCKILYGGV